MPSPMHRDHGKTSRIVSGWLDSYQRLTPGLEGGDSATVKLFVKGEPEPDHILLIPSELGGRSSVDAENYYTGAPELVVEIARATREYDLNDKKSDYERVGVLEYLVVELHPDRIHWFIRRNEYFEALKPGTDGIYRSEIFPGLWLEAEALYAENRNRVYQLLKEGARTPEHAPFVARLARAQQRPDDVN